MVTAAHRGHTVVPVSYKQGTHIDGGVGGREIFTGLEIKHWHSPTRWIEQNFE